jgi:hypothetical protein
VQDFVSFERGRAARIITEGRKSIFLAPVNFCPKAWAINVGRMSAGKVWDKCEEEECLETWLINQEQITENQCPEDLSRPSLRILTASMSGLDRQFATNAGRADRFPKIFGFVLVGVASDKNFYARQVNRRKIVSIWIEIRAWQKKAPRSKDLVLASPTRGFLALDLGRESVALRFSPYRDRRANRKYFTINIVALSEN